MKQVYIELFQLYLFTLPVLKFDTFFTSGWINFYNALFWKFASRKLLLKENYNFRVVSFGGLEEMRRQQRLGRNVRCRENRRWAETSSAGEGAVRPAEGGREPGRRRPHRGGLRHQSGQGSLFAGVASVDAGDRTGGPAGEEHRAADGWDGNIYSSQC